MKAKIWNFNKWIKETDETALCRIFDKMVIDAGFNVLGVLSYRFQPQGFTKIYLLAESHFAIHTFPEEHKTYVELSSCNEAMQKRFVSMMDNIE